MDREVFVTAHNGAQWRGFCKAIERAELAEDSRFRTNELRVQRREELYSMLAPIFLNRPAIW